MVSIKVADFLGFSVFASTRFRCFVVVVEFICLLLCFGMWIVGDLFGDACA